MEDSPPIADLFHRTMWTAHPIQNDWTCYVTMNQAQNKYTPNSGKHVSCVFTRETSFIPCLDSGLFPRVKNYLSDLALVESAIAFRCLTKVDYPINQTSRFSDLTKDILPFDCSRITK